MSSSNQNTELVNSTIWWMEDLALGPINGSVPCRSLAEFALGFAMGVQTLSLNNDPLSQPRSFLIGMRCGLVLRSAGYRENWASSQLDTYLRLRLNDIRQQLANDEWQWQDAFPSAQTS